VSNFTVGPWVAIVSSVVVIVMLFALYALGDELRGADDPLGVSPNEEPRPDLAVATALARGTF
jgi:hypothetical protein